MVYLHSGILFGYEKEWSIDTSYTMSKSWNLMLNEKKPDKKGHILHDSILMKCLAKTNVNL